MPTVLRYGPFRFYFYAGDRDEPPHVHIQRDDAEAKFWLDSVVFERNYGFTRTELRQIQSLIEQHEAALLESWHEFFDH